MEVLLVHPNFPGQFRRIAGALARMPGVRVVGVGDSTWMKAATQVPNVPVIGYPTPDPSGESTHPYARKFDEAVRRGEQVVNTLTAHKQQGLEPDIILAHPGWGDAFFLRDFFPGSKVIGLFEYFYRPRGADVGFDPESPSRLQDIFRLRVLNATQLLALDSCDEGFCPTAWQRSLFPGMWKERLSVLHEGVDTGVVAPDPTATVTLPNGITLKAGEEVLTFVSRNLEPYRGYHVFMRALPAILQARPQCQVLIVGADGASYGPKLPAPQTYRQKYLDEVADNIDLSRVHFTGHLPFSDYVKVLQVSRLHVYLTYPFILSWSMMEAMSAGCLVLASATQPVEEVLTEGENGLLFPFLSHDALARRAIEALSNPGDYAALRQQARQTIVRKYDFETVSLPAYLRMLKV
ncbi:MAG TPA: glycosyltransferase family 4 protein [Ramlibacter sp.]|nr:glycosyltransferase family 4 protein [Ramlibacter sp.]